MGHNGGQSVVVADDDLMAAAGDYINRKYGAGTETSNVNAVMDGALDPFIESYLNCLATGNWVQK